MVWKEIIVIRKTHRKGCHTAGPEATRETAKHLIGIGYVLQDFKTNQDIISSRVILLTASYQIRS